MDVVHRIAKYEVNTNKNDIDNGGYGRTPAGDVYVFFDPRSQIKSADLVTYDDDGNIIPLSERFNESNDDIRYSRKNAKDDTTSKYFTRKNVYKGKKSVYNEFATNAMQWANSTRAKNGDQKIFYNPRINTFVLLEATKEDGGFIEIVTGEESELKGMIDGYDKITSEHDRWLETTRAGQNDDSWDSEYAEYQRENEENGELSFRELGESTYRAGDIAQVGGNSEVMQ